MAKRKQRVWQRRAKTLIVLALVGAFCSFLIGLILPWNRSSAERAVLVSATQQMQTRFAKGDDAAARLERNEAFSKLIAGVEKKEKEERLTFSVPEQFLGKTLENVKLNSTEKAIALTFDDGPYPEYTLGVLEVLKKNNIKGTFFWIGKNLKEFPDIAKAVVADGHAIGNHTWNHWYHQMSQHTAAREIDDTSKLIYEITGVKTSLFRPPGGFLHNGVADYAKKKKYLVAMWSADSIDYSRPSVKRLVAKVMREAKPGGMVLMHDGGGDRSQTVQALPIIIDKLAKQGYKFVTVPELFEMQYKEQQIANG